jgi:hypothetical protein
MLESLVIQGMLSITWNKLKCIVLEVPQAYYACKVRKYTKVNLRQKEIPILSNMIKNVRHQSNKTKKNRLLFCNSQNEHE